MGNTADVAAIMDSSNDNDDNTDKYINKMMLLMCQF